MAGSEPGKVQWTGISDEQRQKIERALREKGATLPCPRCGNSKFLVFDAFVFPVLQRDPENIDLSGTGIPSAIAICVRCGYLAYHALGILGIQLESPRSAGEQKQAAQK